MITSEELRKYADEYRLDQPGEKLTAVSLSKYLEKREINISSRNINRKIGDYIKELKEKNENIKRTAVVYKSLDVSNFLKINNTPEKLRLAISERERYYAEISASAAEIYDQYRKLQQELQALKEEYETLKSRLEKRDSKAALIKEKDELIKQLKSYIDKYIDEDIANYLLKQEGIYEPVMTVLSEETIKENIITADTDIRNLKVGKMLESLDD